MKYVALSKEEFQHIVYPGVVQPRPDDTREARLIAKALDVLEAGNETGSMSLEEMMKLDEMPGCRQRDAERVYALEDSYHEAVVRQLERYAAKVPAGFGRHVLRLVERIRTAPDQPPIALATEQAS